MSNEKLFKSTENAFTPQVETTVCRDYLRSSSLIKWQNPVIVLNSKISVFFSKLQTGRELVAKKIFSNFPFFSLDFLINEKCLNIKFNILDKFFSFHIFAEILNSTFE